MKYILAFLSVFFFIVGAVFVSTPLDARTFEIVDYDESDYPNVSAEVMAFDDFDEPITGIAPGDFEILDNGSSVAVSGLDCPGSEIADDISILLAFDLAIKNGEEKPNNFDLARYFAKRFLSSFDSTKTEFALTSFDVFGFLNADITREKTRTVEIVDDLIPARGSTFDVAFIDHLTSALPIIERASFKKVVVLITDRYSSASTEEIIAEANRIGATIFAISIDDIREEPLINITDGTGGRFFENITDSAAVEKYTKILKSLVLNYKPCSLSWRNEVNCDDVHVVTITYDGELSQELNLNLEGAIKPYVESDPPFLGFSATLPGTKKKKTVKITARNANITITDLSIIHPENIFTIVDGTDITEPVTLLKDESRDITVEFAPTDSALVFARMMIECNACYGDTILITGGFPNTPPKEKTLNITSPECGRTLVVGETTPVRWEGLLPDDVIQLEYTVDDGTTWDTLAKDAVGLEYYWTVPNKPTENCTIRAIQLWPNNIGQTMDFKHDDLVDCAKFSSDGEMIVTGAKNGKAAIWNSNSGIKLFDLEAHQARIRWVVFGPDDRFCATAGEDDIAIIWDVQTGEVKRRLIGHTDDVRSVEFSPDGSKVITASFDDTAIIWDLETGNPLKMLEPETGRLWYAAFDPSGDYVLTCGSEGIATMWNASTWNVFKEFNAGIGNAIKNASFNHKGTQIAAACNFKEIIVWNVASGAEEFRVRHEDSTTVAKVVNSAAFDHTDTLLITAGGDNNARIWSSRNGAPIATLKEHRGSVMSAYFNFDGSRILTSSWDSTAKVWNLDKRDLQMDSTDCAFRIAPAELEAFAVDFGKSPVGVIVDSLIDPFVINTADFPFEVQDIEIIGEHKDDYDIILGEAPYYLDSSEEGTIFLRFKPGDVGERKAKLLVTVPGKTIERDLLGEGYDPGLKVVHGFIDFGRVELGDLKDTTLIVAVRNQSRNAININEFEMFGPDDEHFALIEGGEPITLQSGQEHPMKLRFISAKLGRRNGLIKIKHDGEGSPSKIYLFGEGVPPIIDTATIAVASASGAPGDIIDVPITIKNLGERGLSRTISGFTADLTFDATLLEPLTPHAKSQIDGYRRKISLDIPAIFGADSVLATLQFKVGLGADTTCLLELSNLSPVGKSRIKLYDEAGLFRLTGYCEEGGARLFDSRGRVELAQNVPNPFETSTEFEFEIIEPGRTTLTVIDMQGKVVATLVDQYLAPGRRKISADFSKLPIGSFYYVLQTPTDRIVKRMEINR